MISHFNACHRFQQKITSSISHGMLMETARTLLILSAWWLMKEQHLLTMQNTMFQGQSMVEVKIAIDWGTINIKWIRY